MHYCQPEPVTYRVYTDDSPVPGTPGLATLPGSGQNQDTETYFSPASRELVTVTAANVGEWSPLGWLNEAQLDMCDHDGSPVSQTCGNNVRVRRIPSDETVLGADREFDFAMNLSLPPDNDDNLKSAVAQVFYLANLWHDRMYWLGFNEAAGNFQEDNFDRGGNPVGDALFIRVHDGLNNYGSAGYLNGRSEDGARYEVKLAVMTGPTPDRSAALDRGVVFHELTHAMVARLLVGSSGGPKQAYGMHEGWADFFAVCLTAQSNDNLGAEYPMFAWAARENDLTTTGDPPISHYYFGARRFPYSADMSKNPVTFAHIDPCTSSNPTRPKPLEYPEGQNPPQVPPQNPEVAGRARDEEYTVGLVWAMSLLECRTELAQTLGWSANDLVMQLVMEGIKLCPVRPNFVEARDAILQADVLRHGGVHLPALRTAFAKRGLGWGASSPNGGAACGVIESFEVVPTNDDELSVFLLDEPLIAIHTCEATTFDVLVVGNSRPVASVIGDAAPDPCILGLPSPAELVSPGTYRVTIGPGLCRQAWEVWATATTEGPNAASKSSPPMAVAAGVVEVVFARDMESGTSEWAIGMATPWVSGSSATAGAWFRGDPSGGGAVHPARDATPGPGYQCWMTEQHNPSAAGALLDDVDSATASGNDEDGVWLRSPNIPLDALSPAIVEFQHWFASLKVNSADTGNDVEARADWVRDGTTVSGVGMSLPRGDASAVWRQRRFIAPSGGQTHQVRFHFMDLPPHDTAVEGGIDELRVYQVVSCADCCDADMNRDGNVDQDDVAYLVSVIGGGDNPACIDPDFNHDGNVDQTDIADLLSYVGGDGCP
ncbi:MAG: hypothetical protein DYG92_08650 [Leptolyngbya sp. PLA1]|nr:hypothetical protein [Leptolyngbya sp. PLA1]